MCRIDDADPALVWNERWPKARIEHSCVECHRIIGVTERYQTISALHDHGWGWKTYKTCAQCVQAHRWLDVVCGGWLVGEVHADLRDHLSEPPPIRTFHLLWLITLMGRGWMRGGTLVTPEYVAELVGKALSRLRAEVR